jgi:hypothetical protein
MMCNPPAVGGDIELCAGSETQCITQLLGQDDTASGIDDSLHGIRLTAISHCPGDCPIEGSSTDLRSELPKLLVSR